MARRIARESVTVLENRGLPLERRRRPAHPRHQQRQHHHRRAGPGVEALAHQSPAQRTGPPPVERSPNDRPLAGRAGNETKKALDAAERSDVVIFGLFTRVRSYVEDAIRLNPRYRELIRRTAALGAVVVAVNLRQPMEPARPALATHLALHVQRRDRFDRRRRGSAIRRATRHEDAYPFGFPMSIPSDSA